MKKINLLFVLSVIFIGLMFSNISCKKSDIENDTNTYSAIDNAFAEKIFNDVFLQVHKIAVEETNLYKTGEISTYDVCIDSVMITTGNFPKTLTIDFGSVNGSACTDGKLRKGKINANFTGKYTDSLSVITITFDNYYVDDLQIEGITIITNKGHNSSSNLTYSVIVQNGIITNDTSKVYWSSKRTREWIDGESSSLVSFAFVDDVFSISGKSNGRNSRGNAFTANITTSLRLELNCEWIVSGKEDIKPGNLSTRTVDYGSGSCDDNISVIVNWKTKDVKIP